MVLISASLPVENRQRSTFRSGEESSSALVGKDGHFAILLGDLVLQASDGNVDVRGAFDRIQLIENPVL